MVSVTRSETPSWSWPLPLGRGRRAASRAAAVLREWRRRQRSRAALAGLDARMLRDIGISRGEALCEINKPFWRE